MNRVLFIIMLVILGVLLFTELLTSGSITELTYVVLLGLLAIVCLFLFGFERIRELDIKNLKLTLDQIQAVKKEVYAKERDLKEYSLHLATIIAVASLTQSRLDNEEGYALKSKWFRLQTHNLLDKLDVSKNERQHIIQFEDFYRQIDREGIKKEEKERLSNAISELMKNDIRKLEGAAKVLEE